MVTISVGYGGDVEEVEGIPLSPDTNEYYDEVSGECNITFHKCDCQKELVSFGCAKCERAVDRYIAKMVETNCIKPTEKTLVTRPDNGIEMSFWKNKTNTVFMYTDDGLEALKDNWYYRFLKELPPTLWNVTVNKCEFPCAFALDKVMGGMKPSRVLYGMELPMVLIFPNRYYIIAPALWRSVEEIKESYLQLEEAVKKDNEAKKKQEAEMKARQEGMDKANQAVGEISKMVKSWAKEHDLVFDEVMPYIIEHLQEGKEPDTQKRPIIPARDQRQRYRSSRPAEPKIHNQRPGSTQSLDQARDTPKKEVYTTRGMRIRR